MTILIFLKAYFYNRLITITERLMESVEMKKTLVIVAHPDINNSIINKCWIENYINIQSSSLYMSFTQVIQMVRLMC